MTTETMTVHEALSELKMLDRRVTRKINDAVFCLANRHSNTKINGQTIDEYKASAAESYQSIQDLIKRRAAIRNELSKSNATATVTIAGKEYTVAEAIEMKKSGIDLLQHLATSMGAALSTATRTIKTENGQLEDKADRYLQNMFGAKEKTNAADLNNAREAYISANTVEMIDPLGIEKELSDLNDKIETFEHEVDSKISVSNALTTITISY